MEPIPRAKLTLRSSAPIGPLDPPAPSGPVVPLDHYSIWPNKSRVFRWGLRLFAGGGIGFAVVIAAAMLFGTKALQVGGPVGVLCALVSGAGWVMCAFSTTGYSARRGSWIFWLMDWNPTSNEPGSSELDQGSRPIGSGQPGREGEL